MVFAAIDVGSNTLRLLVADVVHGEVKILKRSRVITRLARGLVETGTLDEKACVRSIEALKDFAKTLQDYNVVQHRCVGTSALREAQNSAVFLARAMDESGFEIEVISGEEEASLIALGVLQSYRESQPFVIMDIGGGSTELIYSKGEGGIVSTTKPIGVVKLLESCIRSDPPEETELHVIKNRAQDAWRGVERDIKPLSERGSMLICTGGTATTLAAIDLKIEEYSPEVVDGHTLTIKRLYEIYDAIVRLPLSERSRVRGLEPERADLIIPGIILTINLMESLGFSDMRVSERGLLDGVLLGMTGEVIKSDS